MSELLRRVNTGSPLLEVGIDTDARWLINRSQTPLLSTAVVVTTACETCLPAEGVPVGRPGGLAQEFMDNQEEGTAPLVEASAV